MPDPVSTYAVDNTAVVNVVANSYCDRILVEENYNSSNPPTADLRQYVPAGSSTPARIVRGTPAIYTKVNPIGSISQNARIYAPGEIAGGIRTETGSITVRQIESIKI